MLRLILGSTDKLRRDKDGNSEASIYMQQVQAFDFWLLCMDFMSPWYLEDSGGYLMVWYGSLSAAVSSCVCWQDVLCGRGKVLVNYRIYSIWHRPFRQEESKRDLKPSYSYHCSSTLPRSQRHVDEYCARMFAQVRNPLVVTFLVQPLKQRKTAARMLCHDFFFFFFPEHVSDQLRVLSWAVFSYVGFQGSCWRAFSWGLELMTHRIVEGWWISQGSTHDLSHPASIILYSKDSSFMFMHWSNVFESMQGTNHQRNSAWRTSQTQTFPRRHHADQLPLFTIYSCR